MRKLKLLVLLSIVAALITGGYLLLRDLSAPVLSLTPATGMISLKRPLVLSVEDTGTGLKSL